MDGLLKTQQVHLLFGAISSQLFPPWWKSDSVFLFSFLDPKIVAGAFFSCPNVFSSSPLFLVFIFLLYKTKQNKTICWLFLLKCAWSMQGRTYVPVWLCTVLKHLHCRQPPHPSGEGVSLSISLFSHVSEECIARLFIYMSHTHFWWSFLTRFSTTGRFFVRIYLLYLIHSQPLFLRMPAGVPTDPVA